VDRPAAPPQWAAERVVGPAEAAELLGEQFPGLRGAPVEVMETGWDNTVHLVGGQWVFRFPRRAVALPGFVRELDVLPRLAPAVPLPVPLPVWRGEPGGRFPWPFAGAALLPGRELAEAALPEEDRREVAAATGAFLRALHDPRLAADVGRSLPVDPNVRADPSVRVPMARDWLGRLVARGLWRPAPAPAAVRVDALLARAEPLGAPAGEPVLVHGDLHVRHVLVDDRGVATGIVDWGDVCLADPAVDLALAYAAFAGEARSAFLAGYAPGASAPGAEAPVGAERELRARVLAVVLSAALAEYAAAEGRPALLTEALAGLRRAVL
jgi:aminoglycoside phosphotransferase (APT) family kinase protein